MSVKLYYFDGRGIGEPIRWIMKYGGIEFEDIRIPYDTFPPNLPADIKSKCRWGKVPLIEFEGKSLVQSRAICRYLSRKVGLVPEDSYEAALCDEYVDSISELMGGVYGLLPFVTEGSGSGEVNAEKAEAKKKEVLQNARRFLDVFESIIQGNGGKHLVGNSTTWADVIMAYCVDHAKNLVNVDLTEGYPNIKNLAEAVLDTPNIKGWLEKRPSTKY